MLEDSIAGMGLIFDEPIRMFVAQDADSAWKALAAIEIALAEGYYVAGYMSYELGYLFEERLAPLLPEKRSVPLIEMAAFRRPQQGPTLDFRKACTLSSARPLWSRAAYRERFQRVKNYICAGDVYQINLTFPFALSCHGDPLALYARIRKEQPTAHGGIVALSDVTVLSWSNELFFEVSGDCVRVRPMKGTVRRGTSAAEDHAFAKTLAADPKQRAENLMIVDLMRNDLGRMSGVGSIRVRGLFHIETYPTFHAMTSTIEGRPDPGLTARDVLRALFPCGSVTGAPKIRAMEIIRELEPVSRGVYCGSIGYFAPDGSASFNVAIRTLTAFSDGSAVYAAGSGIVHDSDPDQEYDECLLKTHFLLGPITG
jgi:aminodeoxychorismate synthase component I